MGVNVQKATKESVSEAARLLANGEIVIWCADGVYAMSASIYHESAIKRIYELKTRDYTEALQVVIDPKDASRYATLTSWQQEVLTQLMPGPISFIVPADKIPGYVNAGLDSVCIGWQDNWILRQLYEESGAPYVGTSANPHGQPPPVRVEEAVAYFGNQISLYLDDGRTKYGVPNAIINLIKTPIEALREGYYKLADVNEMIANRVKIPRT